MSELSEPTRRLFFALWPSDELRSDIERETRHAAAHTGGRVIPAANLHITLAFLGSVPESKLTDAISCARATLVRPFELVLGEFKWWTRQEILCLEPCTGVEKLEALATRLQTALRAKEFNLESRSFRAHLTLARDVRREPEVRSIKKLCWKVERIELIESQTSSRGSVYTVLPT